MNANEIETRVKITAKAAVAEAAIVDGIFQSARMVDAMHDAAVDRSRLTLAADAANHAHTYACRCGRAARALADAHATDTQLDDAHRMLDDAVTAAAQATAAMRDMRNFFYPEDAAAAA